ncbi:hypothetical protein [Haloactinopolyspora sp.]|nr:hypothetical protein [Haloactinopolyspora sp.]
MDKEELSEEPSRAAEETPVAGEADDPAAAPETDPAPEQGDEAGARWEPL